MGEMTDDILAEQEHLASLDWTPRVGADLESALWVLTGYHMGHSRHDWRHRAADGCPVCESLRTIGDLVGTFTPEDGG